MSRQHVTLTLKLRPARDKGIVLATDASAEDAHITVGYLCTTGHAGARSHPYPVEITGKDRTTIAELRAVHYGLAAILPQAAGKKSIAVHVDSMAALTYLREWAAGSVRLPTSYSTHWRVGKRRRDQRSTLEYLMEMVVANAEWLTFRHVKGHASDPMNEAAHYMAYLAKRCRKGQLETGEAERLAKLTMETSLSLYVPPQAQGPAASGQ